MRRSRFVLATLVAAVVAVLATFAAAAPFTSSFDALTADLQSRRSGDYSPPLTKAQKKEVKSIDASLARLARPHADVAADVKSAAFVASTLKAGFPKEFTPGATTGLPGLVAGTFANLVAAVEAEYGKLEDALAVVTDPADRAAATANLTAARKALDTAALPATPPSKAATQLAKALAAAKKGLAIAVPYVDGFLTARVNGRTFVATEVMTWTGTALATVTVAGTFVHPQSGVKQTITFVVYAPAVGTREVGSFSPFGGVDFGQYHEGELADDRIWYSQFGGGSIEITEFDAVQGRIGGRFGFDTMRNGNSTMKLRGGRFLARFTVP